MFENWDEIDEGAIDPCLVEGIDGFALVPDVVNGNGILVSLSMPHDDYDDDENLIVPTQNKPPKKK